MILADRYTSHSSVDFYFCFLFYFFLYSDGVTIRCDLVHASSHRALFSSFAAIFIFDLNITHDRFPVNFIDFLRIEVLIKCEQLERALMTKTITIDFSCNNFIAETPNSV